MKCDSSCYGSVYGCPKNNGRVTSDSSICSVAEMLAIPFSSPFTLIMGGQQSSYPSCTMNGYTSTSWGSWGKSFRIEAGKAPNFMIMVLTLQINVIVVRNQWFEFSFHNSDTATTITTAATTTSTTTTSTTTMKGYVKDCMSCIPLYYLY